MFKYQFVENLTAIEAPMSPSTETISGKLPFQNFNSLIRASSDYKHSRVLAEIICNLKENMYKTWVICLNEPDLFPDPITKIQLTYLEERAKIYINYAW